MTEGTGTMTRFTIKNHRDGTATIYDEGVEIATIHTDRVDVVADEGYASVNYAVQGRRMKDGERYVYVGIAARSASDKYETSGNPRAVAHLAEKRVRERKFQAALAKHAKKGAVR